jgi:hypothetical protein
MNSARAPANGVGEQQRVGLVLDRRRSPEARARPLACDVAN